MKYEYIIWDYNGTLLNDVYLSVEIINEMLAERNLPQMTIEKYRKLFDFPVKDYYVKAGFDFNKESFEKTGTEFIVKYDKRSIKTNLHEGIPQLLEKISAAGIKQSILSARKEEQLCEELKKFDIYRFFEYVYGLDDHYAGGKIEKGKELLKKINTHPDKILLAGDTSHDCEVAKELKINFLGLTYGHHPAEKLKECNNIASNVKDIEKFIFA